MDRYFISNTLIDKMEMYRSWVEPNKFSDHYHVICQFETKANKWKRPIKFNHGWLKEPGFVEMIKQYWVSFSDSNQMLPMERLTRKLKGLKSKVIKWEKEKKGLANKALCRIDELIGEITVRPGYGIFQQSDLNQLIKLEVEKINLLRISDEKARLNSHITWLEARDKNTKNFHKFAEHRRNINTIWSLNDSGGT